LRRCTGDRSVDGQVYPTEFVQSPGGQVGDAIKITNTGAVPYTNTHPASIADEMTDDLDDATFNNGAAIN